MAANERPAAPTAVDAAQERRRLAVIKSVGSARLEGARPSESLNRRLTRYVHGEITAAQLRTRGRD